MKIAFLLLIASFTIIPSLITSFDSFDENIKHKLKNVNPYQDLLEELDGAHLRIAASHVSLH